MSESAKPQARRPLPDLAEADTAAFWAATTDHRLTYQVCSSCGHVVFHPRRHCTSCLSTDLEVRDAAGAGTVYSYSVVRQHGHPFFKAQVPYVVAFVDLDEGFRMLSQVLGHPDTVEVGARVRVTWEDHDEVAIPVFEVADS